MQTFLPVLRIRRQTSHCNATCSWGTIASDIWMLFLTWTLQNKLTLTSTSAPRQQQPQHNPPMNGTPAAASLMSFSSRNKQPLKVCRISSETPTGQSGSSLYCSHAVVYSSTKNQNTQNKTFVYCSDTTHKYVHAWCMCVTVFEWMKSGFVSRNFKKPWIKNRISEIFFLFPVSVKDIFSFTSTFKFNTPACTFQRPAVCTWNHHRGASGGPHRCDLCYATAGPCEAAGRKRRCVSKRLNCCAAAAEPGAHGKPTAAKISPAHRPHWSASPTSAALLAGKLLTMRLNYSQKTQNWFNKRSNTPRGQRLWFHLSESDRWYTIKSTTTTKTTNQTPNTSIDLLTKQVSKLKMFDPDELTPLT